MRIREAIDTDAGAWDAFVDHEGGSFFHYYRWRDLYLAGGFDYVPLMLEDGAGRLQGILPLVVDHGLLHVTLSSMPEGASGGIVFRRDMAPDEIADGIDTFLRDIDRKYADDCAIFRLKTNITPDRGSSAACGHALLRHKFARLGGEADGLPCTFVLPLEQPFDERIWKNLWTVKIRQKCRKVQKTGVEVIVDEKLEYVEEFTDMLGALYTRHDLRPLSRSMVDLRLRTFPKKTRLFMALHQGRPVAGMLCYYTPTTCYLSKAPSYQEAYDRDINTYLFARVIEDACNAGYQYVEFGITNSPSGQFFKERFRGMKIPMGVYERQYSRFRALFHYASGLSQPIRHAAGRQAVVDRDRGLRTAPCQADIDHA
jgi:hypothetical protein